MVRTQIQLTEQQARGLKERAAREKVSMAELVRRSVEMLLSSPHPDDEDEKWERAMKAIGFFDSGLTDLSINHDKYLAEAYAGEPPRK
jgi:hypothetical protein